MLIKYFRIFQKYLRRGILKRGSVRVPRLSSMDIMSALDLAVMNYLSGLETVLCVCVCTYSLLCFDSGYLDCLLTVRGADDWRVVGVGYFIGY